MPEHPQRVPGDSSARPMSGALVGSVAGAAELDVMTGVDQPVEQRLGDDRVREQRIPALSRAWGAALSGAQWQTDKDRSPETSPPSWSRPPSAPAPLVGGHEPWNGTGFDASDEHGCSVPNECRLARWMVFNEGR